MLSERDFIQRLRLKGLIPEKEVSSFREVVGILKWETSETKKLFEEAGFPFLEKLPQPEESSLQRLSLSFIRKERIIPLREDELEVEIATDNPFNYEGIKKVEWIFSKPVRTVVVPFDEINKFLMSEESVEEQEEFVDQYGEDILHLRKKRLQFSLSTMS